MNLMCKHITLLKQKDLFFYFFGFISPTYCTLSYMKNLINNIVKSIKFHKITQKCPTLLALEVWVWVLVVMPSLGVLQSRQMKKRKTRAVSCWPEGLLHQTFALRLPEAMIKTDND